MNLTCVISAARPAWQWLAGHGKVSDEVSADDSRFAPHPIHCRFAAFVSKGIVDDLTGYYNTQQRKFYSIVRCAWWFIC